MQYPVPFFCGFLQHIVSMRHGITIAYELTKKERRYLTDKGGFMGQERTLSLSLLCGPSVVVVEGTKLIKKNDDKYIEDTKM